ncbi:DUF4232 domain-containing protein [Speluncibacter jeojiensis]|uniref:DUF4232 domain-containing protein n=1 Tax=Speluncibacter jeojiensis TaxID=2710754 RepID=A0A9X4RHL4_9ACTN|nr:DUF4232 domain-containing protein [Rhodococcus sp. D2-41]MDG3015231.1 DUF4232 domain-containing protein [Corynebacteriales bacterium D3-21]
MLGCTAALGLSACSTSGSPTAASSSHPAAQTTAQSPGQNSGSGTDSASGSEGAAPATTAAPASTAANPNGCRTGELSITLGQANGAAGSVMFPIVFTNTGSRTCELDGFPGVSYVGADGAAQVGAAATRNGPSGGPVQLAPGAKASAQVRAVQVANYPADECKPTPVSGLRVYPPNDFDSVVLPHEGTGCAGTDAQLHQLSVAAVTGS